MHRSCFLPPLSPQAVLEQLDAADDLQAGSLKNAQANATNTLSFCLQEGAFVIRKYLTKISRFSKQLSASCADTCLYSAGNAHLDADHWCKLRTQAEFQEKEAGSEDGTPAMEASAPRSNTGEIVAHIYLLAEAFPREPLTVKRAIAESSLNGRCIDVHRSCFSPPLVQQAMLAQLDAADDPQAGSLKQKVQANATKTFFPHVACRRERL